MAFLSVRKSFRSVNLNLNKCWSRNNYEKFKILQRNCNDSCKNIVIIFTNGARQFLGNFSAIFLLLSFLCSFMCNIKNQLLLLLKESNTKKYELKLKNIFNQNYSHRKQPTSRLFGVIPAVLLLQLFIITEVSLDYVDAHITISKSGELNDHPINEFSSHTVIRPEIYHGRHKNGLDTTLEEEGLHASHITLSFNHNGRNVIADLQLNEHLIPEGHFLRYQKPNGENIVQNLTKTEVDLCHYQGTIRGNTDSRVAVSTCNGVNGVVVDGADTYFIYSGQDGKIHDDHYLFKHSDMIENGKCGFKDDFNQFTIKNHTIPEFNRILRYKRSTEDNIIRGPYNANKHSSFVELVMVVDNKVYKTFGESMKKVHSHCKDIANIVNALYVPLNIFIALVGVVVWNESNEIDLSSDGDATLKSFLEYRRNVLVKNYPNDNAQLLTKEQFEGGVVGKALKGPICTYEFSGGVSMEHSQIVAVVATTVAHEMGHNFGMEHDNTDCKCVDQKCIMSASSTSIVPRHWSSCSIDQLNVAFSHGMNYCLRNKPLKLFNSPLCGNGFVEAGEQCDCGLPEFCENSCCDPNTCMLHANASCATGECCDLTTCRPQTAGTECRSSEGECDLPEYCTGESEYCPTDVYKRDTEMCDNGNAFCYQGTCRSRSNQCKILWGPSGESSDYCYEKNMEGSRHGNCGYNRLTNKYMECPEEDVYCGMLHCRHLNERLEFGMESVALLSHSFMNHEGSIIPCRTAIVDLGLQSTDPGLTPNGAKCGEGKMCVGQKCVAVESLRAQGQGVACPENCNGQGICNSKGHCHCFVGFAPPYCSNPGNGGSEDSGPATNPSGHIAFARAMYIFFLGVVPAVSLFLFFAYYWRQNRPLNIRKPSNVLKPVIKTNPNRGGLGGNTPPGGGLTTSTPSSIDDMNSALLKSQAENDALVINNSMFGKFRGFTLKPLPNAAGGKNIEGPNVAYVHPVTKSGTDDLSNGVPARIAPPVPKLPPSLHTTDMKINHTNGFILNGKLSKGIGDSHITSVAPALPPLNPGFTARPIISSPVLETSTCTAKELISPLKHNGGLIPVRPAPVLPPNIENVENKESKNNIFMNAKGSTLKRIASFLKKDDKNELNVPKHTMKIKPAIDREKLKNIQISSPMPVVDQSDRLDEIGDRQFVNRTQSMRDPSSPTKKTIVTTFGSMRQPPGVNRPKSIVGLRPKSPPPRPPAPPGTTDLKIPGIPGYQNPPEPKPINQIQNEYDDCEAIEAPLAYISEESSPTNSDNIYSVIEERPTALAKVDISPPSSVGVISGSNDSMGLLGEIVNELEKRKVDSIYSASTLNKKKSLDKNSSEVNEEADYLKSNESTTSSGYLRPSAINTPIARVAPTRPELPSEPPSSVVTHNPSTLSSFKPKNSVTIKSAINNKKDEQKSSTTPSVVASTSPINTRKFGISRTKTPPSISVVNKTNGGQSSSIRKRSPSPVGSKINQISNKIKSIKTSPSATRKNSTNDIKNSISDTTIKKIVGGKSENVANNNITQKPKTLSKPILGSKTLTGGTNNNDGQKIARQNSSSDNKTTLSNNINNNNNINKRTKLAEQSLPNRKSSLLNKIDDSNSSLNSNNKILNAAARPVPGKISNVASLQQKFETSTNSKPTSASSTSFSSNLSATVKK